MLRRVKIDDLIGVLDTGLRTVFQVNQAARPYPASQTMNETPLSPSDKKASAAYMRVNHAGEIAAQALYQGQKITAGEASVKTAMAKAGKEEIDHLVWCELRLAELNSHPSYLAPLWFTGAFMMGALAGMAGDRWSLGFLAETEAQVVAHLEGHLKCLPANDEASRTVIRQMSIDEAAHAEEAIKNGGVGLPLPLRYLMRITARVMTTVAYYI